MAEPRARNGDLVERIERETHVEILPGTELMADIGGAHFIHAHNSAYSTVLVPQPTADPHDPLVGILLGQLLDMRLTMPCRIGVLGGSSWSSSTKVALW